MDQLPSTRSCGACRGCCKPFAVPEVGKLDANWCPKSTPCNGCTIYDTRPEACRKFACIWLNGKGKEGDRPDILGVMMDIEDFPLGEREIGIVHFWEIEAGAIEKPRVREIANANRDAGLVIAYHHMLEEDAYRVEIRLSAKHFTLAEATLFDQTYRRQEHTAPPR